jgi:hypothetical protein
MDSVFMFTKDNAGIPKRNIDLITPAEFFCYGFVLTTKSEMRRLPEGQITVT